MSYASSSRVSSGRPRGAVPPSGLVNPYPVRYPDSSSKRVMTRRGWWLVVSNFLFPGSAQAAAGNKGLAKFGLFATVLMWLAAGFAGVSFMFWRQTFLTWMSNNIFLLVIQAVLIAYALLWVVLTLDTLRMVRLVKVRFFSRLGIPVVAIALLVTTGGGAAYASHLIGVTRDTLGTIFVAKGPAVPPSDGYYNVLLLGVDSGAGRDSMRPDSISVASVNADTGAVTIFGIPRDMKDVPFSKNSPMHAIFPDGYKGKHCDTAHCAINEVFTEADILRDGKALYPDEADVKNGPGIAAVRDAAEGVLGIDIPYYVLIDMDGFAAMIDALGGVDINVDEALPKGGGPQYPGESAKSWATGWIEPGQQHMDGDTAQWYARSRYTTSDWDRMRRQRQLQEAILAQFTPVNVLTRFEDISKAGSHILQTNIPQSMLGYFSDLAIKAKTQPVTTVELTPKSAGGIGIDPDDPNFDTIHQEVHTVLHPPSPSPTAG